MERLVRRSLGRELTVRRAARVIAVATLSIVAVAGVAIRYIEPAMFPNVWLGMWWAAQTATSVGYGDIVPKSVGGRLLAVLVMINGIALLTVVIASISAAFVESARKRAEASSLVEDPVLVELRRVRARLDAIERRLPPARAEGGGSSPDE